MAARTDDIKKRISDKLLRYFTTTPEEATKEQLYKAIALIVRDELLTKKQIKNKAAADSGAKKVYYLCMEFLLGRSLKNNLSNFGVEDGVRDALRSWGVDLDELYETEADAGLGNGGLGRLAACYMDSLATLGYAAMGFSICYEYGLFKQKIVENQQVELPDIWLDTGEIWMMPRSDKNFKIKLYGHVEECWEDGGLKVRHENATVINAAPYDVLISGANEGVSVLRLWKASAPFEFDMKSFTQGDYMSAMRADTEAEIISKVLYPADDHEQGKNLRLSQQYFLVSASLQSIIKDHFRNNPSLDNFADCVAIHINDTHPALAIPELMRLLIDEYGYDWDTAWNITTNTIAYTNHTVMSEALEKWSEHQIMAVLPRIYSIMREIDRRFADDAHDKTGDWNKVERMRILLNGTARMANLSVIGSHKVNGVSELHSNIIKEDVFKDFYDIMPDKFTNVTNGIAYRRWLTQANPRLTGLVSSLIGDKFKLDAGELGRLKAYADDTRVLDELSDIKYKNKRDFSDYIRAQSGFVLNPESRFDTQIKRLHEYKRQLMNVLKIVDKYLDLLDDPNKDVTPETFIFGAKAAGGYYHAKRIISLINALSGEIQQNKRIKEKLDVMFLENYNVTKAEHLIPASEISEQISLAGKEASGTSNMKFMINGAVTLGTVDGANVEILEEVGENNIFVFGLRTNEVEPLWHKGYYASNIYASNPRIKRVVDRLKTGFFGMSFADIANYLVIGSHQIADPYMCLKDFDDYVRASDDMDKAYKDKRRFAKMSLQNIASAGVFSSDRSVKEYADNIWHIKPVDLNAKSDKKDTPKKKGGAAKAAAVK